MNSLLVDLDGVLYKGDKAIRGAKAAVTWLQDKKIPHLYLTNTTSRPRRAIQEKLHNFGIEINQGQILTPVIAAANWIRTNTQGKAALFVPHATKKDFDGVEELPGDRDTGAASVVLGDLGNAWDFKTLNRAFRLLIEDHQPPLIALGMTRYWRAEDGLRLDVAPFVVALEHAIGRKAIVLGKPAKEFFNAALNIVNTSADETFMIGDDIIGDIKGAQAAGLKGLLVQTGKFRPSDLQSGIHPYDVLDSIAELPSWWKNNT